MSCCKRLVTDMAPQRKRARVGDILELEAGGHFAYLQYIGKHPEYGDAVLVSPRLQPRQPSVTENIFSDGYVAFYPVTAAASQGLVKVVGHVSPPALPSRLRRAGVRSGPRVDTWIIEDESGEVVKAKLSEEELKFPIAAIWNHDLLIQRVAEGWTPQREGRGS